MQEGFNWTCPHCNRHATITQAIGDRSTLYLKNSVGRVTLATLYIVCPNPVCQKFTLTAELYESFPKTTLSNSPEELGRKLNEWSLIPSSDAKPFPSYIPEQILSDYEEACLIKMLSPKASATLSRRCLQGMIRDFWQVKSANLYREIESIKDQVDPLTWAAIETVRKVGNIGAHMENDINLIIEVEPQEASLLISLIETLLNDWYISREERSKRLESIISMGKVKQVQRSRKHDQK